MTDQERMDEFFATVEYVGTPEEIRPWRDLPELATSEDEPHDPNPVPSKRKAKSVPAGGKKIELGDRPGHEFRGNQWTEAGFAAKVGKVKLNPDHDAPSAFGFESQVDQFPKKGEPGLAVQREIVVPANKWQGEAAKHVDIVTYRDDAGKLRGVAYHYPQDIPPFEKKGNVNVLVDPKAQRQGIGTKLLKEADKHWDVNLAKQAFTKQGRQLIAGLQAKAKGPEEQAKFREHAKAEAAVEKRAKDDAEKEWLKGFGIGLPPPTRAKQARKPPGLGRADVPKNDQRKYQERMAQIGKHRAKARARRAKSLFALGDEPGHPFRGNQWTDGDGGETLGRLQSSEGGESRAVHAAPTTTPSFVATKSRLEKLVSSDGHASISDTAPATRAAHVVAGLLEEMKAQGYEMPDNILIESEQTSRPHAEIRGTKIPNPTPGSGRTHTLTLAVMIPRSLPADANLDDAVVVAFGAPSKVLPKHAFSDPVYAHYDGYAVRNMKDVVTHEMGHVQAVASGGARGEIPYADLLNKGTFGSMDSIRRAMYRVSEYAQSDGADEFLAEGFTRLHRGETLAEDSQRLYDALNGPKVKR